jgi:hypothetical protein
MTEQSSKTVPFQSVTSIDRQIKQTMMKMRGDSTDEEQGRQALASQMQELKLRRSRALETRAYSRMLATLR